MDMGYGYFQVTGPKVSREKYPSVNQHHNIGGTVPGFVAEFYNERGKLVQTSSTYPSPEELEPVIDATLLRYM